MQKGPSRLTETRSGAKILLCSDLSRESTIEEWRGSCPRHALTRFNRGIALAVSGGGGSMEAAWSKTDHFANLLPL